MKDRFLLKLSVSFILILMLFVAGVTVFAGGAKEEGEPEKETMEAGSEDPAMKRIHLALVSQSATWPWALAYVDGVKKMAKELGADVTITDANWDPAKQADQMSATIKTNPDVIVIQHGQTEPLEPLVRQAQEMGIPVINTCLIMEDTVCEIDQNDAEFMETTFRKMAEDLNGKGEIALMWVGGFAPMERRKAKLNELLKEFPDIKIVSEFGSAGASVVADNMAKMEAVIKAQPDLDAVLACWDQFAIAAFKAIKASRKDIPIYSIDIDEQDVSMMREEGSPWKFTSATDSRELGKIAARVAVSAAFGEPVPESIYPPVVGISQEMLNQMPDGVLTPSKEYFPEWGETDIAWNDFLRKRQQHFN